MPTNSIKKNKKRFYLYEYRVYTCPERRIKKDQQKKQCGSKKAAINLWASSSPLNALQREHLASQLQAFIAYNKKWNKNIGLQYLSRPHRAVAQTEQLSIRVLVAIGKLEAHLHRTRIAIRMTYDGFIYLEEFSNKYKTINII